MDLRQLEVFLEVKEQLHFGRAAERLYLAQPTVSETVRRLERELGGRLFERSTRRVRLTPLGEAFAPLAREAYDSVLGAYDAGRAFAREEAHRLVVGHTGDYHPLVDTVVRLQAQQPGVHVSLRARPTSRLVAALAARQVHAIIGWDPEVDEETDTLALDASPLLAVLPEGHPLTRRDRVTLDDLAAEPLLGWPRSANPLAYDRFAAAMDGTDRPWALVGTAQGHDDVVARVLSGFGVGIGYGPHVGEPAFPGVVVREVEAELRFTRTLAWPSDGAHPAVAPFVALVRERHGSDEAVPAQA